MQRKKRGLWPRFFLRSLLMEPAHMMMGWPIGRLVSWRSSGPLSTRPYTPRAIARRYPHRRQIYGVSAPRSPPHYHRVVVRRYFILPLVPRAQGGMGLALYNLARRVPHCWVAISRFRQGAGHQTHTARPFRHMKRPGAMGFVAARLSRQLGHLSGLNGNIS